jgi:hypothetical protein
MSNGERVFYTSENGDRWLLLSTEEDIASVCHITNAAFGGDQKIFELGGLVDERHSAQNQALRALISSLTRAA